MTSHYDFGFETVPNRTNRHQTDQNDLNNSGNVSDVSDTMTRYETGLRKAALGYDLFGAEESGSLLFELIDGWVALYKILEDGRRQILHFALPGALLGFAPGRPLGYGGLALTPATARVIERDCLYQLFHDYPDVGLQLTCQVASDRSAAYDHLSSLGRKSARERVAHRLLELFVRFRMRWPGHRADEIILPLTQEHIADATALTCVHVNRVLRDLRADQIVEFHYRRLRVLDPDKLADAAKADPQIFLSWANGTSATMTPPDGRLSPAPISSFATWPRRKTNSISATLEQIPL